MGALVESLPQVSASIPKESSRFQGASSVLNIREAVESLPEPERLLVQNLFEVSVTKRGNGSRLEIPEAMKPLVLKLYGNGKSEEETLEDIKDQLLVRIQDRFLKSEAVYNHLRRKRPQPMSEESLFLKDIGDPSKKEQCPFCHPEDKTPFDSQLGRLSRNDAITAVNITKFSDEHFLVLGEHDPYSTKREGFMDQMDLLLEYANSKAKLNSNNRFARFGLNRGYKAAGSQPHDHPQGELRAGSMHFPYAERLNEIAHYYNLYNHGTSYFDDFFNAHRALGLAVQVGEARVMSMLVPLKEHGVMITEVNPGNHKKFSLSEDFLQALWDAQQFLMKEEGVREYNFFILPSPISPINPESAEYWGNYRTTAVIVDRGHSTTKNSDWGYAELSRTSVISFDPFDFGPRLNAYLLNQQKQQDPTTIFEGTKTSA